jgi:hypothetical protein
MKSKKPSSIDNPHRITKEEFGRIMHDPNATEDEIKEALKQLEEADGYENLGD